MNYLKPLYLIVAFLLASGCASVGPKIVIETDEPAEDFLVLCEWQSQSMFKGAHGGGTYRSDYKVIVTESGKEVDCGFSVGSEKSSSRILHPILVINKDQSYEKDGINHIVMNKTNLDVLDEQKAKFEAGYWKNDKWPESRYADSVKGICWFPYQYFDYYRKERDITLNYFKAQYYKPILQCYRRVVPILKKYDKSYKSIKSAEEYVKGFWDPRKWKQFNEK